MRRKRIAIFGAHSTETPLSSSVKTASLLEQYGSDNYEMLCYEDVVFELQTGSALAYVIGAGGVRTSLEEFDTVYLRAINDELVRAAIGRYCFHKGIRVLNSENLSLPLTSKLSQYTIASFEGVPIPRTFFCLGRSHWHHAKQFLSAGNGEYVIKSITGANGRDNIKVDSIDNTVDISQPSVIQEYIANDYEYRVIVVDARVSLAYKKISGGVVYQNNIARGGHREPVDSLPPQVSDMAIRMAQLTKREIAGVDVVYGRDGEYRFFEVNYSYGHPSDLSEETAKIYGEALARMLHGVSPV